MGFITFFVCYALFTMYVQKDTLIYAKFITTDAAGKWAIWNLNDYITLS